MKKILIGFFIVIFLLGSIIFIPQESDAYFNSTINIYAEYKNKKVLKFKVYYRRAGQKKYKYYGKTENGKHSHNWTVGVVYEIMVLRMKHKGDAPGEVAAATIRYKVKNAWSQDLHFSLYEGAQPWP